MCRESFILTAAPCRIASLHGRYRNTRDERACGYLENVPQSACILACLCTWARLYVYKDVYAPSCERLIASVEHFGYYLCRHCGCLKWTVPFGHCRTRKVRKSYPWTRVSRAAHRRTVVDGTVFDQVMFRKSPQHDVRYRLQ